MLPPWWRRRNPPRLAWGGRCWWSSDPAGGDLEVLSGARGTVRCTRRQAERRDAGRMRSRPRGGGARGAGAGPVDGSRLDRVIESLRWLAGGRAGVRHGMGGRRRAAGTLPSPLRPGSGSGRDRGGAPVDRGVDRTRPGSDPAAAHPRPDGFGGGGPGRRRALSAVRDRPGRRRSGVRPGGVGPKGVTALWSTGATPRWRSRSAGWFGAPATGWAGTPR